MDIFLISIKGFAVVELCVVNTYDLLCHRCVVIARIVQVLPPSFWDAMIAWLRLLVGQAVH